MPNSDELDALAATPIVLKQLLAGEWTSRPAGDEGWTANEIVAHLRDCEEFFFQRCQLMATKHEPLIAAFDQDALARERNYAATDVRAAMQEFGRLRQRVLGLLTDLSLTDWRRAGRHEETGRITIESYVRHMISHDLVHLRQISLSLSVAD